MIAKAASRVFVNGRIFTANDGQKATTDFAECMALEGDKIAHVGSKSDPEIQDLIESGIEVIDLEGQVVIPGLIDAHTHLLFFGLSQQKLDLTECASLESLQSAISKYARTHPELPRVLCRGWLQSSTGRQALATMLDDVDPHQRPVYVESLDLHSTWVNTAALNELPFDGAKDLGEHQVPCDENGRPTGLFAEAGQTDIVWHFLNEQYTQDEKLAALQLAFDIYIASGYTGAIDMAMDDSSWDILKLYRERHGTLPIHVAAHWLIRPTGDTAAQVDVAIAHNATWHPSTTPDFCIVGIKLICDGTVDGCTAALSTPYPSHPSPIAPLFSAAEMSAIVSRAAAARLQVAIHAIGDTAVSQAISSIAASTTTTTTHSPSPSSPRHRIEHLEVTSPADAALLGALGITASVQPVHSDPAILSDYPHLVGPHLWTRAFAYKDFLAGHACVALGTDAPTARHSPLPNLYTATTRRSAMKPEMQERTNEDQALSLSQAVYAATAGAAYSRFAEGWTGSLKKGLRADFAVVRSGWTPEGLLGDVVEETWVKGRRVFVREGGGA